MSETFSWTEGNIYVWTGTATASAQITYAENNTLTLARGWDNRPTLAGTYNDHLTGMRADLSVGALYAYDNTLARMIESATAIHLHLKHSGKVGSAGYYLYSGYVDSIVYNGAQDAPYRYTFSYHANRWSAYGG